MKRFHFLFFLYIACDWFFLTLLSSAQTALDLLHGRVSGISPHWTPRQALCVWYHRMCTHFLCLLVSRVADINLMPVWFWFLFLLSKAFRTISEEVQNMPLWHKNYWAKGIWIPKISSTDPQKNSTKCSKSPPWEQPGMTRVTLIIRLFTSHLNRQRHKNDRISLPSILLRAHLSSKQHLFSHECPFCPPFPC